MVALGKWLEPKNILFWPKFRLDNCSVTEVEFTPEPRLLRLNDTSHLQAL
jgi:broad specificity phosphatase PhoE